MNKGNRSGFTLVEIMIAMALFSVTFGSIAYMVIASLNARHESEVLNRMVTLARAKMNEVKTKLGTETEEGTFDAWPEYSYQYSVLEIEVDLFRYKDLIESPEDEFKKTSDIQDTATGGIVKLLHYNVLVKHKSGDSYALDFYRSATRL